jgi:hypothetical protein
MSLLDWLRKSSIFRFGFKKSRYNDAKERPIEFQDSGVFDSEKDLMAKKRKSVKRAKK